MEIRELAPHDTGLAYEAMRELRPQLADEASFVAAVERMRPMGYRLVVSMDGAGRRRAVAAMGMRRGENLSLGDHVYVDDLVTLPAYRGQGHGRALLDWARAEAERAGCAHLHLDSATHRHAAHRLYLRWGLDITAFHFVASITRVGSPKSPRPGP
ncbi:MAG TPA: GNAT family N-acetyltransferase [Acidimicrobiales bacterium]|nr:GNAT family N-acetyltransferase [Acidimicrobiales bacterium]